MSTTTTPLKESEDDDDDDRRRRRSRSRGALSSCCAWRVDVTVSSSQAKRVLRPTVLMTLKSKRGSEEEEKTFEMSLEMFRELRVTVAKMLTEMKWTREEMERTTEEDDE